MEGRRLIEHRRGYRLWRSGLAVSPLDGKWRVESGLVWVGCAFGGERICRDSSAVRNSKTQRVGLTVAGRRLQWGKLLSYWARGSFRCEAERESLKGVEFSGEGEVMREEVVPFARSSEGLVGG